MPAKHGGRAPCSEPLRSDRLVVSSVGIAPAFTFPRQFIERRLPTICPVEIFGNFEFWAIIFDADAMLVAPTVPLSVHAFRFHRRRIDRPGGFVMIALAQTLVSQLHR